MGFNTTFRFPAYRQLIHNLGVTDATLEATELAVREFVLQCSNSGDKAAHIQALSKTHGVKVDSVDLGRLSRTNSQLYILAVYPQLEDYLESFRREHPRSRDWEYPRNDDKEELIKTIMKNVCGSYQEGRRLIGTLEIDIIEYYRLVRHRFMHPQIEDDKVNNKTGELRQSVIKSERYPRLSSPNAYEHVAFDDFVLFTRSVKQAALQLCIVGRPEDHEIANVFLKRASEPECRARAKSLRRLKNNPSRARNVVISLLGQVYGLTGDETHPIADIILADLLA